MCHVELFMSQRHSDIMKEMTRPTKRKTIIQTQWLQFLNLARRIRSIYNHYNNRQS